MKTHLCLLISVFTMLWNRIEKDCSQDFLHIASLSNGDCRFTCDLLSCKWMTKFQIIWQATYLFFGPSCGWGSLLVVYDGPRTPRPSNIGERLLSNKKTPFLQSEGHFKSFNQWNKICRRTFAALFVYRGALFFTTFSRLKNLEAITRPWKNSAF